VDPRAGMDDLNNRKSLAPAGNGTPDRAARSLVTIPTTNLEMRVTFILNKCVHLRL
jgi:hypothetical protein